MPNCPKCEKPVYFGKDEIVIVIVSSLEVDNYVLALPIFFFF